MRRGADRVTTAKKTESLETAGRTSAELSARTPDGDVFVRVVTGVLLGLACAYRSPEQRHPRGEGTRGRLPLAFGGGLRQGGQVNHGIEQRGQLHGRDPDEAVGDAVGNDEGVAVQQRTAGVDHVRDVPVLSSPGVSSGSGSVRMTSVGSSRSSRSAPML